MASHFPKLHTTKQQRTSIFNEIEEESADKGYGTQLYCPPTIKSIRNCFECARTQRILDPCSIPVDLEQGSKV